MFRKKMNRKKDRKQFGNTARAGSSHRKNFRSKPKRGGWRL